MLFDEVNLAPAVLDGLQAMNFKAMTPVQEAAIPIILQGKDLIACAQTGTGKTAAYVLPLLSRLIESQSDATGLKAIVMAPTRELAQQIDLQFEGFSYFLPISTTVVYGGGDGAGWDQQKKVCKMQRWLWPLPGDLSPTLHTAISISHRSNTLSWTKPIVCSIWAFTRTLCRL